MQDCHLYTDTNSAWSLNISLFLIATCILRPNWRQNLNLKYPGHPLPDTFFIQDLIFFKISFLYSANVFLKKQS